MCLWAEDLDFAVPLVSAEFAYSTAIQLDVDQSNQRRISSMFTTTKCDGSLSRVPCVLASVWWEQVCSPGPCLRFTHLWDDPALGHLFLFSAITFFFLLKIGYNVFYINKSSPLTNWHIFLWKKRSLVTCIGSPCFLTFILSWTHWRQARVSISQHLCYCLASEICMRASPYSARSSFWHGVGVRLVTRICWKVLLVLDARKPVSMLCADSMTVASSFVWPDPPHLPNSQVLASIFSSPLFSFATCPRHFIPP